MSILYTLFFLTGLHCALIRNELQCVHLYGWMQHCYVRLRETIMSRTHGDRLFLTNGADELDKTATAY